MERVMGDGWGRARVAGLRLGLLFAGVALIAPACKMLQKDTTTGTWKGTWSHDTPKGPEVGGKLDCTIEPAGRDEWKALFEAEWGKSATKPGQSGIWKVELMGRRQEGKVVFGGDVNLGGMNGVFHWSGEIVGENFNGKYTSQFVNGTFELKKVSSKIEPKVMPSPTPAQ